MVEPHGIDQDGRCTLCCKPIEPHRILVVATDKENRRFEPLPQMCQRFFLLVAQVEETRKVEFARVGLCKALCGLVGACRIGPRAQVADLDDQIELHALFPLPAIQHAQRVKDLSVHVTQEANDH